MSTSPAVLPGPPPLELASVREDFPIAEAFAWAPAVWGSVLLVLSGLLFFGRPEWSKPLWYGLATLFAAAGLALIRHEFKRRQQPTVLVPITGADGSREVALW